MAARWKNSFCRRGCGRAAHLPLSPPPRTTNAVAAYTPHPTPIKSQAQIHRLASCDVPHASQREMTTQSTNLPQSCNSPHQREHMADINPVLSRAEAHGCKRAATAATPPSPVPGPHQPNPNACRSSERAVPNASTQLSRKTTTDHRRCTCRQQSYVAPKQPTSTPHD